MILLSGADISISRDEDWIWTARVSVGYGHATATHQDPIQAIGLACLMQAGVTTMDLDREVEADKQSFNRQQDLR